jgi:hypothetical protein
MAQILPNFGNYYLYVYHAVAAMVAAQAPPRGIPTGTTPDLKARRWRPEPPHP